MLEGENIVYFGSDWNGDNKTSCHHVAEYLSKKNLLLYVESAGMRRPRSSSRDLRRLVTKFLLWLRSPRYVNDHLCLATVFLIPFHRSRIVRRLNKLLIISFLRLMCKRLKFRNHILWITLPHMETVAGSLGEKFVVYYCADKHEALPGVDAASISLMERKLLRKADTVFAVNEQLLSRVSEINSHAYLSPHGVDVEHFGRALDPGLPIPEDITCIPSPRIGFFGLIERWIDQELIRFLAESRPSWSFVFIGRVAVDTDRTAHLPNVHFLGKRSYADLPSYAKGFDVAIIPYVINEQTLYCNPMKLREYLAAARPTVAVSVPEICKYDSVVQIAESYDQFLAKIQFSLENNSEDIIRKRIEKVVNESWSKRLERVSNIVAAEKTENASTQMRSSIYEDNFGRSPQKREEL